MRKTKRSRLDIVATKTTMEDDNRLFCRFALDQVPVRFKDLRVGERGAGVCKDIGGGGAGLECSREVRVRTPLEMWFELADGFEPMHILGKVVWTRMSEGSCKVGVAFDKPRFMSLARILRLETTEDL